MRTFDKEIIGHWEKRFGEGGTAGDLVVRFGEGEIAGDVVVFWDRDSEGWCRTGLLEVGV